LDQNQWISLARAYHGREPDPVLKRVVELARSAVAADKVRFPISRSHLIETTKVSDDDKRKRLIEVFLHFGRGWIVKPAELIHAEELLKWSRGEAPRVGSALDRGLLASYSDYSRAARNLGISVNEVEELDRFGDSPEAWNFVLTRPGFCAHVSQIQAIAQNYAKQVEAVRSEWAQLSRQRRKVIFAEGLIQDTIKSLEPISPDLMPVVKKLATCAPEELVAIISEIPSIDVLFVLSEAKTRDMSRPTDPNDLWDLGFLAPAIPYCEAVVTEKYWSHLAKVTKLDSKYSCRVQARLADLIPLLEKEAYGSAEEVPPV
jgi:hypothetical protein